MAALSWDAKVCAGSIWSARPRLLQGRVGVAVPRAYCVVPCCIVALLQIWFPPFHQLTRTEVEYLVKAISVVYGVDEDLVLQQQPAGARGLAGVRLDAMMPRVVVFACLCVVFACSTCNTSVCVLYLQHDSRLTLALGMLWLQAYPQLPGTAMQVVQCSLHQTSLSLSAIGATENCQQRWQPCACVPPHCPAE